MISPNNLKQNPYISLEMDYPHEFIAPPIEDTSCSDWLWLALENDEIDKIYAMRVLPLHDIIAFKIKFTTEDSPHSEIVQRPEFSILKPIWDCGNAEFNKGIKHYLHHSKHALHQFSHKDKFPFNTPEINKWYFKILSDQL